MLESKFLICYFSICGSSYFGKTVKNVIADLLPELASHISFAFGIKVI